MKEPITVPLPIAQAFELAQHYHKSGRLHDAEVLYRRLLGADPENILALHYLGVLAYQAGHYGPAIELIQRALQRDPNYSDAYDNLGSALKAAGKTDEAIKAYRRAIELSPRSVNALKNLAIAYRDAGDLPQALAKYHEALSIEPDNADILSDLAHVFWNEGRHDDALPLARRAIAINPRNEKAFGNLGNALNDLGHLDEAISAFQSAIAINPDIAGAHLNLGLCLLERGELIQGWPEYEWRWKAQDDPKLRKPPAAPQWDGSPLVGKTLVLHTEQGLGDAIQFVRYLPMVLRRAGLGPESSERDGSVCIECHPQLVDLFESLASRCTPRPAVFARGQAVPPYQWQCPLLSLPLIFQTTQESIPADVPYLFPDPAAVRAWRNRLDACGPGLKVGLAWFGSPDHRRNRTRSLSLDQLAPLAQVPNIQFISLQKGPAAEQAKHPPQGLRLIDWSDEFSNFNDAALIANLDLVLTIDTSIAHLAGALARPTWIMLAHPADWRWLRTRTDSPWYPTARLFRQPTRGDWTSVIHSITTALSSLPPPSL